MDRMQQYVRLRRYLPSKRYPSTRIRNHKEILPDFADTEARSQASHREQCGQGAAAIGAVERHIAETAWQNGWVRARRPKVATGYRVAIVGAGPAGMAAADELCATGHDVHLFDRHPKMGGLMSYGIPEFKMKQEVVARRATLLIEAGVVFRGGSILGETVFMSDLRASFNAVILAYGAQRSRHLNLPGEELSRVVSALDYLVSSSRAEIGETPGPEIDAENKWVVVIGGGETAMDCVRTAVRQGAAGVTCLYHRDRGNMPGSAMEVSHVMEEAVQFEWLRQPEALSAVPVDFVSSEATSFEQRGAVRFVHAVRTRMETSAGGFRTHPRVLPGPVFHVAADLVVNALGFEVEDASTLTAGQVKMNSKGYVAAQDNHMTSSQGVFVAGNARLGPSLAVWAIRDGREVAASVHRFLKTMEVEGVGA